MHPNNCMHIASPPTYVFRESLFYALIQILWSFWCQTAWRATTAQNTEIRSNKKQFIFQGKSDHLKFCLCRLKKVFWTKPQCFLYLNQPESHNAATHPAELICDSAGKYEHLIWWAGWTNTSSQLTVKHNMLNIHKQSSGVNAERELVFVLRSIIAGEPSKRRRGG